MFAPTKKLIHHSAFSAAYGFPRVYLYKRSRHQNATSFKANGSVENGKNTSSQAVLAHNTVFILPWRSEAYYIDLGSVIMVSGTSDNPLPRVTLGEIFFHSYYMRWGRQLGWAKQLGEASCLASAGRVTLAGKTTFVACK